MCVIKHCVRIIYNYIYIYVYIHTYTMSYITLYTLMTIAFCTELTSNVMSTDGSWVTSSGMMGHNWIRVTEPAKAATSSD